ncbi:probable glutamate carboxypeptidase VP8 [Zea mays]|uniref:probable glutamate carboxypeptidase VP8 n=1 Tax=Zea mays TaxID=4577 RepID=UPI000171EBEB|nr:probable glutamate carboxypeptidase VP8 [Zea mays]ACA62934.1 putative membrane localized peptidase [Zea mays]|eukprot:NP_001120724.1 probable glutamate carboxypeptidase VP8 [Zea mays]
MPHSVLARLPPGSVRLVAAFGLLLIVSLLVLHRRPGRPHVAAAAAGDRLTDPSRSRLFLSQSPGANASIAADLRALTAGPHLAGTPASAGAAAHVLARLRAAGLQTLTREYEPLLSYPGHASLALLRPDGSLLARLSLEEPADEGRRVVPPYHAYAPSGGAVAEAVFVNLGREEDYVVLERLGVGVRGRVAVARRGGGYRGGVVARAADKGAVAVLIAGNADGGVERGVVLLGGPGDPLTPGWAATSGAERLKFDDKAVKQRFPSIPSMPVSAKTAAAIIRSLGGPAIPAEWKDGLGVDTGGVGPGPTLVNFTYQEDRKFYKIRDIFGIIKGQEEPDRYVILGNHRDAWTYGAVDPNSGTAALLDIARRLGIMLQSGWKPRRSIILCSWDGEEFGMIGSTEWVEDNLEDLHSKAVAYLNVDCAVQGVGFFAGSTPQLDKLLVDITRQVRDPDVTGKMVHDTWNEMSGGIKIERLARTDSDFAPFLHHAGIPSVDLYYGEEFPGYHTALDTYNWMEKHGDPFFLRHLAITEIWGLLALRLANDPVLPFDYQAYTSQLQEHIKTLSALTSNGHAVNLMNGCVNDLSGAAMEVLKEMKKLQQMDLYDEHARMRRRLLNDRLLLAERSFLQPEGLQGRGWFKHLLYSPPEDYESKLSFFPGIADAISRSANLSDKEQEVAMQHEVWKVCRAIQRAASVLRGEFSEQKPTNFSSLVTP